jgi:hypothetical protein
MTNLPVFYCGEDRRFLFRVVKSQADNREIDDFMTVPRSRPG